MKKVYLHLGFHKTATSSFQASCVRNAEKLEQQGYRYPVFTYTADGKQERLANHSVPIFSSFTDEPEKYHVNIKRQISDRIEGINRGYLEQLKEHLASATNLILSGEDISILSDECLADFVSFLERYEVEIIPLACVRSPYSYHCSVCAQVVRNGAHNTFIKLRTQRLKVQRIRQAFGDRMTFIPFAAACKHQQGPVGYLFDYIGVDLNAIEVVAANQGLGNVAMRIQNTLNRTDPMIKDGALNPNFLRVKEIDGDKFLLTAGELAQIENKLEIENKFFHEQLGAEFADKSFPVSDPLSLENLVGNCSELFIQNDKILSLAPATVDYLRDRAIEFEQDNLPLAHDLMSLANEARPDGQTIKEKLETYRQEMQSQ